MLRLTHLRLVFPLLSAGLSFGGMQCTEGRTNQYGGDLANEATVARFDGTAGENAARGSDAASEGGGEQGGWGQFTILGGDKAVCRAIENHDDPLWLGDGPCEYCAYECKLSDGTMQYEKCKFLADLDMMNCSSEAPEPPTIAAPICESTAPTICCDGQTNGCGSDGYSLYLCSGDATSWILTACGDSVGKAMPCMELPGSWSGDAVAYCPVCWPGERDCMEEDDVTVIECNLWGIAWDVYETCDFGKKCFKGVCSAEWGFEK